MSRALKQFCNNGHAMTPDNTYIRYRTRNNKRILANGSEKLYIYKTIERTCLTCRKETSVRRYWRLAKLKRTKSGRKD